MPPQFSLINRLIANAVATHLKVASLGTVSFYERKEKKGKKLTKEKAKKKKKYRSRESFKAPHFSLFFALSSWEGGKRRREGADRYDCKFSEVVCAILLDEMARFPLGLVLVLGLVLSVVAPAMAQQAPAPSPQSDGEFMDLVICFIFGVRSGNDACQIASKHLSNLLFLQNPEWLYCIQLSLKILVQGHGFYNKRLTCIAQNSQIQGTKLNNFLVGYKMKRKKKPQKFIILFLIFINYRNFNWSRNCICVDGGGLGSDIPNPSFGCLSLQAFLD